MMMMGDPDSPWTDVAIAQYAVAALSYGGPTMSFVNAFTTAPDRIATTKTNDVRRYVGSFESIDEHANVVRRIFDKADRKVIRQTAFRLLKDMEIVKLNKEGVPEALEQEDVEKRFRVVFGNNKRNAALATEAIRRAWLPYNLAELPIDQQNALMNSIKDYVTDNAGLRHGEFRTGLHSEMKMSAPDLQPDDRKVLASMIDGARHQLKFTSIQEFARSLKDINLAATLTPKTQVEEMKDDILDDGSDSSRG